MIDVSATLPHFIFGHLYVASGNTIRKGFYLIPQNVLAFTPISTGKIVRRIPTSEQESDFGHVQGADSSIYLYEAYLEPRCTFIRPT